MTTKGRPQSYIPLAAAATVGLGPKPLFANLRLSAAGKEMTWKYDKGLKEIVQEG